jgi:hypothetical protein
LWLKGPSAFNADWRREQHSKRGETGPKCAQGSSNKSLSTDKNAALMLPTSSYLSIQRQDFLNAHLVNEVLTTQVNQMGSLLVIRQVRTNAVDHHHDESEIIHIEPLRTADELVFAIPDEWTVKIG